MDKVNIPNILSIVGAIFIAAVVSTLIFSVLNALGLYGEAAKALVQSLIALAVIPVFRNVKVPKYVLIFMVALIPPLYLTHLQVVASVLVGWVAALANLKPHTTKA